MDHQVTSEHFSNVIFHHISEIIIANIIDAKKVYPLTYGITNDRGIIQIKSQPLAIILTAHCMN